MVNPDDVREILKRVQSFNFQVPGSENGNPHSAIQNSQSNCGVGSFFNIMPNADVFPCHILTGREFRCGNLPEQSLVEIYRRNGLLGRLSALNYQELAKEDLHLTPLTRAGACMGDVYAQTKSLPVWRNNLSLNRK